MSSVFERQPFAVRVLGAHIRQKRLAHAYLITGERGAGKKELALAFTRALNCAEGKIFGPCGCASCRKAEQGNHPDIRLVGTDPEARTIKIEEIRDLIQWASLKPYEGRWKAAVLIDAGRLGAEASNAFLKTLEEPPAATVFCLTVGAKGHLLETIQSRAFEIRLMPGSGPDEAARLRDGDRIEDLPWSEPTWEDFLGTFEKTPKEELKIRLEILMRAVRDYTKGRIEAGETAAVAGSTEALDRIYETQEALAANVNQKLALTRLAVHLRRHLPYRVFKQ